MSTTTKPARKCGTCGHRLPAPKAPDKLMARLVEVRAWVARLEKEMSQALSIQDAIEAEIQKRGGTIP
jgi:hypothetical protein